jgi:hypothetical protein
VDSWPKPILAIFGEESSTECSRYIALSTGTATAEVVGAPPVDNPDASTQIMGQEMEELSVPPPPVAPPGEGIVKESLKVEMVVEKPVEVSTKPCERGQALIHCHKCKAQNSPTAERCQQCTTKLLPAETAGSRLTIFFSAIFAAGLFGYLIYRWFIQYPGSAPDIPFLDNFLNPIVLGLATLIALITAITMPLRRTPEYAKYKNRAIRHIPLNPWQALDDLESAMESAPDKEQGNLLKERAKLFEKVGFAEEAARDYLVLATSPDRHKGEADFVSLLTGGDAEAYQRGRRSGEILTILGTGKANAVGYCSKCNDVVLLDKGERCPQHPKTKGRDIAYVIPADLMAGKISVMQKLEGSNPYVREKLTELLSTEKAIAVGYCTKCSAIVEMDPQRRCRLHNKAHIKHIQYALPKDLAIAKKRILKVTRSHKTEKKRKIWVAAALALLLIALMLLVDIDLTKIFAQ